MKVSENPKSVLNITVGDEKLSYNCNTNAYLWNGEWCESLIIMAAFPVEYQVFQLEHKKRRLPSMKEGKIKEMVLSQIKDLEASIEGDIAVEIKWNVRK